jgi:hypothetical protein
LYWDIDKTDWNAVWDTYKPKFDALPNDLSSKNEAFEYFSYMSGILSDGHYSFALNVNGVSRSFSPAFGRVNARADANAIQLFSYENDWTNEVKGNLTNYDFFSGTIINYLQGGTTLSGSHNTNRAKLKCGTGHIKIDSSSNPDDYILYLYFDGFSLAADMNDEGSGGSDCVPVLKQFFRNLCEDTNVKGLILDVRGNDGGSNDDISLLLGPIISDTLEIAKTRVKSGPGRLQYAPWVPFYVYPAGENPVTPTSLNPFSGFNFFKRSPNAGQIPVVAVVNEYSISCAELTAMAVMQMPNSWVVGKTTFGATGPRMGIAVYTNGGPFYTNPRSNIIMDVTQAGWATQSVNGINYEGIGIPPNKDVSLNWTKFYGDGVGSGRDDQLEAAIKHIDPRHVF